MLYLKELGHYSVQHRTGGRSTIGSRATYECAIKAIIIISLLYNYSTYLYLMDLFRDYIENVVCNAL